jgi:nitrite reductase/ring-hydroxylating ferredoxin subunit
MTDVVTEDFLEIGRAENFAHRSMTVVEHDGKEVAVVRWDDDQFFVLHNRCPHMGGPIGIGNLGPRVVCESGDPMHVGVEQTHPVIACPWHRWEFDATTGGSFWNERVRVRTYDVRVEDGRVLASRRPARSKRSEGAPT